MKNKTNNLFADIPAASLPLGTGWMIAGSTGFCIVLVILRIIHTGSPVFLSMIWNLFLAFLPWLLSSQLARGRRMPITCWSGFLLWLLFIPNAFYLITDLFHLDNKAIEPAAPTWFDLVLLNSFAWNGLMMGILSVRQMEKLISRYVRKRNELLFVFPLMWFISLGVYLGRYLRFNSWDLFTHPFSLLACTGQILAHPLIYRDAWGMVSCYSIMLSFMYCMLKKMVRAGS